MGTFDSLNDGQQQVSAATAANDVEAAAGTGLEDEEYDHDDDVDRLWLSGPASSDPLSPIGVFGEPYRRRITRLGIIDEATGQSRDLPRAAWSDRPKVTPPSPLGPEVQQPVDAPPAATADVEPPRPTRSPRDPSLDVGL